LKGEDARTLLDACRALVAALAVPVVVHDRADVAAAGGAAGVHLSPGEIPAAAARVILRPGMLVGVSVGGPRDLDAARAADYVSIGPIFAPGGRTDDATALGLEELGRLARRVEVPIVAVGGIDARNARAVLDAGASGVAVIAGAFAKTEAARAIRELRDAIET
jgi:thiamine-phosphate pyrophosphorylase